ncbi:DUF1178 family protein [Methylibium rhizosphaerae]|uniref:DUF1178 family protein n=1 Tax=Methylibium rhizosphaerae TaxID=2570323 RepID=UPI00112DBE4B|nr:DUF1178 family protein [Methylibium rhizosphaerae]
MKVLNLQCSHGHGFEGWFGSEDDYQSQLERGLVECPLCADKAVTRLPSAPRLNLSGSREEVMVVPSSGRPVAPTPEQASVEALWLGAVRHVMANTEDVGERFAEEARRIHYGETEHRGIRGRASTEDAQALRDEGIEVMALPLPAALKGPTQ